MLKDLCSMGPLMGHWVESGPGRAWRSSAKERGKWNCFPEISENKSSVSHNQVMYAKCHSDLAHGLNRNLLHVERRYQILHMA
jgi:hypothetical protein